MLLSIGTLSKEADRSSGCRRPEGQTYIFSMPQHGDRKEATDTEVLKDTAGNSSRAMSSCAIYNPIEYRHDALIRSVVPSLALVCTIPAVQGGKLGCVEAVRFS